MKRSVFITGTDTGIGKTLVTGLLGKYLADNGFSVVTQKWVQTGFADKSSGDIQVHLGLMGNRDLYRVFIRDMVPYTFAYPASPHFASLLEKKKIKASTIIKAYRNLEKNFDIVIVEGTGGVLVPLSGKKTVTDIVADIGIPVILVSENRLGTINQILLSIEALKKRDIDVEGVIFNRLSDKYDETLLKANIKTVKKISGVRVFGELRYEEDLRVIYRSFADSIGKKISAVLKGRKK